MPFDHRYLWSTRFVSQQLRVRGLSEAATFRYFLAIMAFDWLQFTVATTTPRPSVSMWSASSSWATFAVTLAGLVYLYFRNGGQRGTAFLYRYFPLSVTVGWKFVVAMFIVMWLIAYTMAGAGPEVRGWSATLALTALNIAMFLRIGAHMARLANDEAA